MMTEQEVLSAKKQRTFVYYGKVTDNRTQGHGFGSGSETWVDVDVGRRGGLRFSSVLPVWDREEKQMVEVEWSA